MAILYYIFPQELIANKGNLVVKRATHFKEASSSVIGRPKPARRGALPVGIGVAFAFIFMYSFMVDAPEAKAAYYNELGTYYYTVDHIGRPFNMRDFK